MRMHFLLSGRFFFLFRGEERMLLAFFETAAQFELAYWEKAYRLGKK